MKTMIIFAKLILISLIVIFYLLTIGVCFAMTTEIAVLYGTAFGMPILIIQIALVTVMYYLCANDVFCVGKS